jgi:hypothetical protein
VLGIFAILFLFFDGTGIWAQGFTVANVLGIFDSLPFILLWVDLEPQSS